MDEVLDDGKEESDGDELLTEEEMKAFRERLVAKKGAIILPLQSSASTTD